MSIYGHLVSIFSTPHVHIWASSVNIFCTSCPYMGVLCYGSCWCCKHLSCSSHILFICLFIVTLVCVQNYLKQFFLKKKSLVGFTKNVKWSVCSCGSCSINAGLIFSCKIAVLGNIHVFLSNHLPQQGWCANWPFDTMHYSCKWCRKTDYPNPKSLATSHKPRLVFKSRYWW